MGHGDRKQGVCSVLYDPEESVKGAKLALATQARKQHGMDFVAPGQVYLPAAAIKEDLPWRKKKSYDYVDPRDKTKPSTGAGDAKGPSRMGSTHHALFVRDMVNRRGDLTKNVLADPREQLLRHGDVKDAFTEKLMGAYKRTQPERMYDVEEGDGAVEAGETAAKRKKT